MKTKKCIKILAVAAASLLILFIFILFDNFVGNPLTSGHIKNQAETLINSEYGESNFQVSSISYDRFRKNYIVDVAPYDQTNIDGHFTLVYSRYGSFKDNSYNSRVAEKSNTHMRLLRQYAELLMQTSTDYNLSNEKPDYIINFGGFIVPPKPEELESDKIYSTAELNEIAEKYGTVTVYVEHENPSLEVSVDIIKTTKDVINDCGISFNNMSFSMYKFPFEKNTRSEFRYEGLLQSEIAGENLIEILETKKVDDAG